MDPDSDLEEVKDAAELSEDDSDSEVSITSDNENTEIDSPIVLTDNSSNITSSTDMPYSQNKTSLLVNDDSSDEEDDIEYNMLSEELLGIHDMNTTINNKELHLLTKIKRDKQGSIIDKNHLSIPILTKYEKTRILGQRAKQIDSGSQPFIEIPKDIIDSLIIAEMELKEKKIPYIIKRPLPGGKAEYWKLSDLLDL